METTSGLLKTKQHFEILDGLRGVAAIVVVFFHFMEISFTDYNKNWISHGYLAVDFFFCLSGFVIAYAYDNRAKDMTLCQFLKLRLIRLHPLVVIGSILGLITFFIDPFSNLYTSYGFVKTALLFITSALVIPYPVMPERYFNLFCLNAPSWSLFWEYVANLIYILILWRISRKTLITLTIIAAIVLCYVSVKSGSLGGGWGGENFLDGSARIAFSFLMGMLVYRLNWIIRNQLGFFRMAILLLIAFLVPFNDQYNWLVEPILVLIYFPLLVSLGAGSVLHTSSKKMCKLSGDISYPLYMTHYPFIWIFLTYVGVMKPPMSTLTVIMPIGVILLTLFAYLVMRYIDEPIRKYLKNNWL